MTPAPKPLTPEEVLIVRELIDRNLRTGLPAHTADIFDRLTDGAVPNSYGRLIATIDAQAAEISRLRTALTRLANAADEVGVRHWDTDSMDDHVFEIHAATQAARELLKS